MSPPELQPTILAQTSLSVDQEASQSKTTIKMPILELESLMLMAVFSLELSLTEPELEETF